MLPTFLAGALFFLQTPVPPPAEAPAQEPAPKAARVLLTGATVHTMVTGEAPRVADVLIEGERIVSVGGPRPQDADLVVIDLAGKHLVPGLIDAHVNFDPEHDALYLAAGVTLVRDVGGDHGRLTEERAPVRRDALPGPSLLTAGAVLDGDPPSSAMAVVLRNAHAAEDYLPILFEENVDFLATMPGLPEDAWRKAIELAHAKSLTVFGPRPQALSLADALAAGQDGFHGIDALLPAGVFWEIVQTPAIDASISALAQARAPLVPLFAASALRLDDQGEGSTRASLALLAPGYESWWMAELTGRKPFLAPDKRKLGERVVEKQARALKSLFDAGVRLVPGSGSPQPWLFPGQALQRELVLWQQAGIPAQAVLELATRGTAEALGLAGQRGTLQPGAVADALVLDRDPREDVAHLADPARVVVRGRVLTREELEERLSAVAEVQKSVRVELAKPVAVEPPPTPEGAVVILEGTVETESFGTRVSSERYRVARLTGGGILYSGRVVYPRAETTAGKRELTVEQIVRDGKLEDVHVVLEEPGSRLEHKGMWSAGGWRTQSALNGKVVATPKPLRERPLCTEVGSVTTYLLLGQQPVGPDLHVLQLHAGFDGELVTWRSELDDHGDHQVRTHIGQLAFRLDEHGAIAFVLTRVGGGEVRTRALAATAFGGPGLPLSADKRAHAASAPVAPAVPAGASDLPTKESGKANGKDGGGG